MDPGNARLRNLVHDILDSGAWRLLWIPPSWPYYETEGEFANTKVRGLTKRLIFSSWQVVPKVVAALLTYEAERRMLGIAPEGEPESHGAEARRKRRGLLRFSVSEGRVTGMPVLGLLYPSFVLAREADPRQWARTSASPQSPTLADVLARVREVCAELMDRVTVGAPADGEVDERWYWAAPIMLDLSHDARSANAWLGQANLATQWRGEDETSPEESAEEDGQEGGDAWAVHVREAREVVGNPAVLGRPPTDLADVLSLLAVAGPAVNALRALARVAGGLQRVNEISVRNHAGHVAEGFRSLFNQPDVMVMLRHVNGEEPYWQRVLEYCARGGLQAVLDEYAHVLVEHLGVSGRPADEIERQVSAAMSDALTLRTATVAADAVEVDAREKRVEIGDKLRFRTRFAVRFGGGRSQEEVKTIQREGDVQKAFNSPFWPFVLCSTSVGQEGLDFHLYCHAVMHWNLPSNPVDLEQREGRVHRYKGHAVRKNVARDHAARATYAATGPGSDSWRDLFEAARSSRPAEHSDLVPFWVYTTEGGATIERHLPLIPLSRDAERAEVLRRSLAVYRMAFGQSRQDDLVKYLQRYLTPEQIATSVAELRIDLAPDSSPNRHWSGVSQSPGELPANEPEADGYVSDVGLSDLERLLNEFAKITSTTQTLSTSSFERLLDDFAALKTH
jgi:hypothetical protein